VGEPVLIYIHKLYCSDEHRLLMTCLDEGRVYRAFKINPKAPTSGYRIPLVGLDGEIVDNFIMMGDTIDDEGLHFEIKELRPEDLEVLELEEDDIDMVCDFFGFTNFGSAPPPNINEEDVVIPVKTSSPMQTPPEYGLPPKESSISSGLANGVDLNYAKYLLYEIRERNPDVFLSIFNTIVQIKNAI